MPNRLAAIQEIKLLNTRTDKVKFKIVGKRRANYRLIYRPDLDVMGRAYPSRSKAYISSRGSRTEARVKHTIIHELFHLFGLEHSDNQESIMSTRYTGNQKILDSDIETLEKINDIKRK